MLALGTAFRCLLGKIARVVLFRSYVPFDAAAFDTDKAQTQLVRYISIHDFINMRSHEYCNTLLSLLVAFDIAISKASKTTHSSASGCEGPTSGSSRWGRWIVGARGSDLMASESGRTCCMIQTLNVMFDMTTSSVDEAQIMIYTDLDMRVQASKALRSTPRYRAGFSAVVTWPFLPKFILLDLPLPLFCSESEWATIVADYPANVTRSYVKFLLKNREAREYSELCCMYKVVW